MNAPLRFLLAGALLGAFSCTTSAREIDQRAEAIVAKAQQAARYAGDDGRVQARMLITDRNERQQQRVFTLLRRDIEDGGDQDFLVVFSRPADVHGTVLLVNKKTARDDDRWLYLPALDLDKRISAGDKRTSFVGSDFFYEDISGRNPALDWHDLVSESDTEIVIRCEPKQPDSVEFAYSHAVIDPKTFLPIRAEYYNDMGELFRTIETLHTEVVQGHPTVLKSQVTDLRSGSRTVLEMRNPQYDIGLDASAFSTTALRNPPQQWLRP
jgi:hypothetical protein